MMTAQTNQKKRSKIGSTQKFTEIEDIRETVVLLINGNACSIIQVQATNFTLLSPDEQHDRIYAYASLLNSLSFPIQIVTRNKKVDISSYVKLLDSQIQHMSSTSSSGHHMKMYRDFIGELVQVNTVLDKQFYIVVSYSYLEGGGTAAIASGKKTSKTESFYTTAKAALHAKTETLLSELARLNLHANVLEKEELITLFYSIYNEEETPLEPSQTSESIQTPVVTGQKQT